MEHTIKPAESSSGQSSQQEQKDVFESMPDIGPSAIQGMLARPDRASRKILQLQRIIGNRAVSHLLKPLSSSGAVLQRKVGGLSTVDEVKANREAWNIYKLLSNAHKTQFQTNVENPGVDIDLDIYRQMAKVDKLAQIKTGFAGNIVSMTTKTPDMIQVNLQDVTNYGYAKGIRFRWFNVGGPFGTTANTFGINLHRGPVYSNVGHAWLKMGPNQTSLTFSFDNNDIGGAMAQVVTNLEGHAAADPDVNIQQLADNNNLP